MLAHRRLIQAVAALRVQAAVRLVLAAVLRIHPAKSQVHPRRTEAVPLGPGVAHALAAAGCRGPHPSHLGKAAGRIHVDFGFAGLGFRF